METGLIVKKGPDILFWLQIGLSVIPQEFLLLKRAGVMSLPGDTPLTPDKQCDFFFFSLPGELPLDQQQHLSKCLDVLGFYKDDEGVGTREWGDGSVSKVVVS